MKSVINNHLWEDLFGFFDRLNLVQARTCIYAHVFRKDQKRLFGLATDSESIEETYFRSSCASDRRPPIVTRRKRPATIVRIVNFREQKIHRSTKTWSLKQTIERVCEFGPSLRHPFPYVHYPVVRNVLLSVTWTVASKRSVKTSLFAFRGNCKVLKTSGAARTSISGES